MTAYNWQLMKDTLDWKDKLKLISFILSTNKFTQGEKVQEFEWEWTDWLHDGFWLKTGYSLYVTSGSTANFLLLDAVKEKYFKGKKNVKVLLPACTWVTNINPIIQLGMEPVFADVSLHDFAISKEDAVNISKSHEIDIVFTTHLLGIPAPIESYKSIFPNAIHLDDVCESHGVRDTGDKRIGANSTGATFSFYYGHHMSTIEGGMITTNDSDLYNIMRMKRSHGMSRVSYKPSVYTEQYPDIDPQFLFVTSGYNFRNTELGAVLGLSQLKKLDSFIERRNDNYFEFLENINSDLFFEPSYKNGISSFCFPLIAKDKKTKLELIERLKRHKIEYRPVVGGNLLRQPYMKGYDFAVKKTVYNADIIHENGIYVGNNQFVKDKDVKLLTDIMKGL